jgi:hypothetical protein
MSRLVAEINDAGKINQVTTQVVGRVQDSGFRRKRRKRIEA